MDLKIKKGPSGARLRPERTFGLRAGTRGGLKQVRVASHPCPKSFMYRCLLTLPSFLAVSRGKKNLLD